MALYHFSARHVSRGKGQMVVASAAYISGQRINGKVPTARWKREKEELQAVIEELKADNQPYQEELAFVKKVQSCADIARRDREMAEADTSGRSEEKSENQTKFPVFHAVQTEEILEENSKAEQQPVNQSEQKPEKKTFIVNFLDN